MSLDKSQEINAQRITLSKQTINITDAHILVIQQNRRWSQAVESKE